MTFFKGWSGRVRWWNLTIYASSTPNTLYIVSIIMCPLYAVHTIGLPKSTRFISLYPVIICQRYLLYVSPIIINILSFNCNSFRLNKFGFAFRFCWFSVCSERCCFYGIKWREWRWVYYIYKYIKCIALNACLNFSIKIVRRLFNFWASIRYYNTSWFTVLSINLKHFQCYIRTQSQMRNHLDLIESVTYFS